MAATDIALVHRVNYVGVEALATPGTPVPALRQLAAMDIAMAPSYELQVFGPQGQKADTVAILNKEWSEGDVTGVPTYDELIVPFASIFGNAVTAAAPGTAGLGKRWTFVPLVGSPDAVQTYTLKKGASGRVDAQRTPGAVFSSFGFSLSKSGGTALTGTVMGLRSDQEQAIDGGEVQTITITGNPTGGTFTISYAGQTTAPAIPYNATAQQVAVALRLLSNIGDNDVACAGGPLPGTPVQVQFAGALGAVDVALMTAVSSLTGGTTPAVAIAQTTAFGPITAYPMVPIAPGQVCVYLNDTFAAIGTSLLLRDFLVEFGIENRRNPVWPLNCQMTSYDGTIETKPDPTISLKLGNDPVARALYDTMRVGGKKYLRVECIGPVIDGTCNYRFRFDACVIVADNPSGDDEDGLSTITFPFRCVQDAVSGLWMSAIVDNVQATL